MNKIPLDLIGAITGIIGTITGMISLIWHIYKNKPILKLERAYFKRYSKKGNSTSEGYDKIVVKIVLRNLGHRSTTIDDLWITYGVHQVPRDFEEITIPASSSKTIEYILHFEEGQLEKMFPEGEIKIGLNIIHTFGRIKRESKTTLKQEDYNF